MSTISWTNAAGGSWSTGSNWSGGVAPTAADDAVIALPGTYTVTGLGSDPAHSVTLNDSGATLSFGFGSTLALGASLLIDAGTFILGGTIAGGTIDAIGGTFFAGSFSTSATLSGVTVEGTLTPEGPAFENANLNINGGLTLEGAGGIGSGTIEPISVVLLFAGSQTLSGGTVVLDGFSGSGGSSPSGLAQSGPGTLTLAPNVTVIAENNASEISGTVANQGLISIPSGANLFLTGSFANAGTITGAGGTITAGGSVTAAELRTFAASGAAIVLQSGTLDNTGGTLSVGPSEAVPLLTLGFGGEISNGVVLDSSGSLIFSGGTLSDVTYQGTLVAGGTGVFFGATSNSIVNGITLLNAAGTGAGVLDIEGGARFGNTETVAEGTITLGGTDQPISDENTGFVVIAGNVLTLGSLVVVQQTGLVDEIVGTSSIRG